MLQFPHYKPDLPVLIAIGSGRSGDIGATVPCVSHPEQHLRYNARHFLLGTFLSRK